MIRHVSISAHDPAHVADVLAELMGGKAYPFPGGVPNAFVATAGDARGTSIEVYRQGTVARPGAGGGPAETVHDPAAPEFGPFHLLLSTPLDEAAVMRIGAREGWRTKRFGRGAPGRPPLFEVIEFWLENRFLVELSCPDMGAAYEETYRPEVLEAFTAVHA